MSLQRTSWRCMRLPGNILHGTLSIRKTYGTTMNQELESHDETYHVVKKTVPTFYFIGVTTGKSSSRKVFPLWMRVLGREEVVMEGIDFKIHDEPESYRKIVAQIKYDPLSLGGLVTT